MKALTICQPYAELIATGVKWVENRIWFTSYRGPLAIHANKSRLYIREGVAGKYPNMAFGAIVAVATLHTWVHYDWIHQTTTLKEFTPGTPLALRLDSHPHAEGPYCWVLADVRRLLRPLPYRGQRRLWNLPANVARGLLRRQYVIETGGLRSADL